MFRYSSLGILVICVGATGLSWPASSRAQQITPTPIVHKVRQSHDRIEMIVNSSRILTLDQKIPQTQVNNPEILAITPLSETQVQIHAKKPGVTQVNLWNEAKEIYTVDVIIYADAQELANLLQSQFPKASLTVIPLANSVVISGFVDDPQEVGRIIQIAEDFHPKVINHISVGGVQQVLLHCRVLEVSRTKLRDLGVDWGEINGQSFVTQSAGGVLRPVTGGSSSSSSGSSVLGSAGTVLANAVPTTGAQTLQFGIVEGAQAFNGFLAALSRNDLAKILAEPTLVCVSGRPAQFQVGGEFPFPVPQSLGTISMQWKQYGTQLDFVPIVLGNGRLRLEVRPRVTEIDPTLGTTINGTTVPALKTRQAETGVEMRAGDTLAIAGLVYYRLDSSNAGIPWVKDIPVIGVAFRRVTEKVNEVETLILVTPQFVEGMSCEEAPPGGPGLNTSSPSDKQFYWKGFLEVPVPPPGQAAMGAFPPFPGSGAGGPYGAPNAGPDGAGMMYDEGLIGPAPTQPAPEQVTPRPAARRQGNANPRVTRNNNTNRGPAMRRPASAAARTATVVPAAARSNSRKPSNPTQNRTNPRAGAPQEAPGLIGPVGNDVND